MVNHYSLSNVYDIILCGAVFTPGINLIFVSNRIRAVIEEQAHRIPRTLYQTQDPMISWAYTIAKRLRWPLQSSKIFS